MSFVLSRNPNSGAHFLPIHIGEMKASIQASENHYCSPRETFVSSDEYDEFEVALIFDEDWFHPEKDERFANATWAKYWSESDDVAARVPRSEIVKMLKDLQVAFQN